MDTERGALPEGDGAPRTFAAITELIGHVERTASSEIAVATDLIETIAMALQHNVNPSLLMGILLEGIAQSVLEQLPAAEQRDTAIALCGLLWDRISQGLAGPGTGAISAE